MGGYGFVATPSPMVGAGSESPLVTWGSIASTPLLLDHNDLPAVVCIGAGELMSDLVVVSLRVGRNQRN